MSPDGATLYGVVTAVLGLIGVIYTARNGPDRRPTGGRALPAPPGEMGGSDQLRVSPEIWRRFEVLEAKVDHLTTVVETKKIEVTALERLLRQAMRIIRRANRRLAAHGEVPEEIPRELIPYSIE